jgi:hypothetical protein
MSDETFFVAVISGLAVAVVVWLIRGRRRRLPRSLDNTQLDERGIKIPQNSGSSSSTVAASDAAESMAAPNIIDALARVIEELDTARRLLEDVYKIGLWSKSDDSSDSRRKRAGLRETDWAVSGAIRALTELRDHQPDIPAGMTTLEDELRLLVAVLEPLPGTVTDTMGENGLLDSTIGEISSEISNLMARASQLADEYRPADGAGTALRSRLSSRA